MIVKIVQERLFRFVDFRFDFVCRSENQRRRPVLVERLQRLKRNQMFELCDLEPVEIDFLLQPSERGIHDDGILRSVRRKVRCVRGSDRRKAERLQNSVADRFDLVRLNAFRLCGDQQSSVPRGRFINALRIRKTDRPPKQIRQRNRRRIGLIPHARTGPFVQIRHALVEGEDLVECLVHVVRRIACDFP